MTGFVVQGYILGSAKLKKKSQFINLNQIGYAPQESEFEFKLERLHTTVQKLLNSW